MGLAVLGWIETGTVPVPKVVCRLVPKVAVSDPYGSTAAAAAVATAPKGCCPLDPFVGLNLASLQVGLGPILHGAIPAHRFQLPGR